MEAILQNENCLNLKSAEFCKVSVTADYCGGEFFDGDQISTGAKA